MTCDDDDDDEGNLDVEEGSKGELAEISKGDSVENTHISIPLPGHDVRGDYCVEIKEKKTVYYAQQSSHKTNSK